MLVHYWQLWSVFILSNFVAFLFIHSRSNRVQSFTKQPAHMSIPRNLHANSLKFATKKKGIHGTN